MTCEWRLCLAALVDAQAAIAKVLLIVGFSMAMKGGGEAGKISQLTTGLSEVDKTFAVRARR